MDLYIFDFDDTLAITDSRVKVIRSGEEILMTSREFAHFPFNPSTDSLDFGDFGHIRRVKGAFPFGPLFAHKSAKCGKRTVRMIKSKVRDAS
mgnify:CR=1 FL=1